MNTIISISEIDATEIALKQIYEDAKPRIDTALAMACTEETKQTVKKLRAELNKEFKEIDDARKAAIKAYEEPERMRTSRKRRKRKACALMRVSCLLPMVWTGLTLGV